MSRSQTLLLEGKLLPEQTLTYPLLPFDVPDGVTRIDVRYSYSEAIGSDPHLTGGNTVDIGIFDPRGHEYLGQGFRGWSGSARTEFTLSAADSTPGYMPGPLPAGTWHICLGAYKIAEDGCDYLVTVILTFDEAAAPSAFPARLPLSAAPRADLERESGWYKGELHCHTYHSDGDSDPLDVVRRAEALGLDFLAITDHNVLSHQVTLASADTPLMLIPGMEVTTYRGHWNIWGAGPWIDFRVRSEQDMQRAVNAALEHGYLISCNHPRPYGPEWEYPAVAGFHCIEVWNGPWMLMNDVALAYWEGKLKAGERYTAVGGSDCHFHKRDHHALLANPTTYIYCEGAPSPAALLASLRAGRAFVSESPSGPELYLSANDALMGDSLDPSADATFHLRAVRAAGLTLELCTAVGVAERFDVDAEDWRREVTLDVRGAVFVRAQVVSGRQRQVHALTNPIYIQQSPA